MDEAKAINLSLSALGNCIQALVDQDTSHVPFRTSKLTRLLQQSLGGNARTSLVVTMRPGVEHLEETLGALNFGSRAMKVGPVSRLCHEAASCFYVIFPPPRATMLRTSCDLLSSSFRPPFVASVDSICLVVRSFRPPFVASVDSTCDLLSSSFRGFCRLDSPCCARACVSACPCCAFHLVFYLQGEDQCHTQRP